MVTHSAVEVNTNGSSGNYDLKVIVNGSTIHDSNHTSSTLHFFTFPKVGTIIVSVELCSNSGTWSFFSAIHKDPSVPQMNANRVLTCSKLSIGSGSCKTCDMSIILPSGLPSGAPTYLEELHKLDNTNKSQYFAKGF